MLRPLPRAVTRPLSIVAVAAWLTTMGVLIDRSYLQASPVNLATDLARYGTAAQWRGVYYRGEKIGFTVSQVQATDDGFELQEDGRLQFTLLGAITPAIIRTTARVDRSFALRSFDFSLDPGTGPMSISGHLNGLRLGLTISSASGKRTEVRRLKEPPALMLSVGRRLASEGLTPGTTKQWAVFDPATMHNAPVTIDIGGREIVDAGQRRPIPAFKVQMTFSGLRTTAWVTDTGEIVREESPMGLITVLETQEQAMALAVSNGMQADMLETAAIVPVTRRDHRIVEPRDVVRLKLRLTGVELAGDDLQGVGQSADGNVIELIDARQLEAGPADRDLERYLKPEPFIESDAPEIRAEAEKMVAGITGTRARAERLVREVNSYVEKRPTVSLPSALEVLRTRVGDCNEHTALFVAMARALGIPARISVGLAFVRGAFYYHAWPEVYIDEGHGRGLWLPVDPTFNQFPADATHLRLARGGLDKQTAILPLLGRARIAVVDLEVKEGSTPILVGARPSDTADMPPLPALIPRRQDCGCWASPCSGASR
ncbi:MAG TPA: transglutaminase-like domain-containing protein [Vicinamibacterales bacterium]|nr:transglutaminase-like domain-containing protein [Vicinamibacterales bacterium]